MKNGLPWGPPSTAESPDDLWRGLPIEITLSLGITEAVVPMSVFVVSDESRLFPKIPSRRIAPRNFLTSAASESGIQYPAEMQISSWRPKAPFSIFSINTDSGIGREKV
ncbi:hypothetical protein EB061_03795 [bacterium]|nr:hypothetical protein [bacterium]